MIQWKTLDGEDIPFLVAQVWSFHIQTADLQTHFVLKAKIIKYDSSKSFPLICAH